MPPPPVIRLHPDDNVVIARVTLLPGTPLGENAAATQRIPAGHKAATRAIAVAGTATSCAAIDQALDPYDSERVHGYVVIFGSVILGAMTLAIFLADRIIVLKANPGEVQEIIEVPVPRK